MKTKLIKFRDYNIIISNEPIRYGDYWVYICPINGLDYGDNNKPIVLNNLPSSWFEKLHDKDNYYRVIASDNPEHNLPNINYNGLDFIYDDNQIINIQIYLEYIHCDVGWNVDYIIPKIRNNQIQITQLL